MLVSSINDGLSQDILIDNPVRAGELVLFPSVRDANKYYYLSDKPRLSQSNGKPEFSFLRYVDNVGSDGAEDLTEGEGGGIVHAVVELNVTEAQLDEARGDLRRINSRGEIVGPCIYEGGTIALISSIVNPESEFTEQVLGLGKAPILDGQKAAVSILLTKQGAKLLWESFKQPTPDISFSFEMDLKGYKSPIGAVIEANFDRIYEHEAFSAGAITRQGGTILGGEINLAFEELRQNGAIKVTSFDPDADTQKAIDEAYSKLTRMMFDPANNNTGSPSNPVVPTANQTSILDRAQELLSEGRRDAVEDFLFLEQQELRLDDSGTTASNNNDNQSTNTTNSTTQPRSTHQSPDRPNNSAGYDVPADHIPRAAPRPTLPTTAVVVSYSMRRVRQTGNYRIDLNKFTTDIITMRFDQNVGTINCSECFREFNMGSDQFYRQREIATIMDGYNASDFEKFINYVAVTFRKKHAQGEETTDEIRIDRSRFNKEGNFYKFLYGWKGDDDRSQWLDYEYKTVWSFFGGTSKESDWIQSDVNTIPLTPPYQRKVVDVELDKEIAQDEGIRSAEVKVFYEVEGKEIVRQVRLNPRSDVVNTQVEILEPASYLEIDPKYEYEISWIMRDGNTQKSERKTGNSLVIFADQL